MPGYYSISSLLFGAAVISNKMSAAADEDTTMMNCASCGEADGDDIKLKRCACKLVKYCSVKCQKHHRKQHKRDCKRRVAELNDEISFKQPESTHLGDCPICCLPLPIDREKCGSYLCCSKKICQGCEYANRKREIEGRLQHKCPFCRKALPETEEEANELLMKRIEANDPVAMREMGKGKNHEGDYEAAFDYLTRAAALGDAVAHYNLSIMYHTGKFVGKDEKKRLHHLTVAAIAGNPFARHDLGCVEGINGQHNRAAKHFIISAKLGHDGSLECVKEGYQAGLMSKEDFTAALRGYQAAIAATRSPQREEAYAFYKKYIEGKV